MQLGALVRDVMAGLQLARPGPVLGNGDPAVSQMLSALAAAAEELCQRYPYTRRLDAGCWLQPANGPAASTPGLDTDEILFDAPVIRAAMKWRWQEWNGLDYAEAFRQAEEGLARAAARHTAQARDMVGL